MIKGAGDKCGGMISLVWNGFFVVRDFATKKIPSTISVSSSTVIPGHEAGFAMQSSRKRVLRHASHIVHAVVRSSISTKTSKGSLI